MKCGRREFLKAAGASAAGVILAGRDVLGMGCKERPGEVAVEAYPRRILGKTGEQVSMIAFGGIVVKDAEPAHAAKVVGEAFGRGINYFDVAPTYGDAELKLGPALKPYRDKVFLACKTQKRDRAGAEKELRESLKRLQTNRFDLYQLHAITDVKEDVEAALGKGGAMEAIVEAKKQGLLRYIGFTAHSPEAALTAMRWTLMLATFRSRPPSEMPALASRDSTSSPSMASPITHDTITAPSRTHMTGELNCATRRRHHATRAASWISLRPYSSSRLFAYPDESPSSEEFTLL